ncbi:Major capsid protein Gp5 [Nostoc flagelliforme CCNUN1]|uniref:Major capsid protein Gp5 n=1 Tax=Nostoc flagelliforme CCNUN1 TaxID=2038116 RepID=A0A2K8SLG8_9NOSO|nr:P22 phage major capsid protein family protein [Nostoc flagelliforme]AUB36143.1 Major capsid protein Gp5 [Nostoc flagelliforme CCNUN1]
MANSLDAAIPRILAQGLKALRENAVMAQIVNRSFDVDAQREGASVDVPIPSAMGEADDVTPSANNTSGQDVTPKFVPVKLNRWKKKDFYMTDKDLKEVMGGYFNLQVTEAARSIANAIDKDILRLYKGVWGVAGLAGQTPFQFEDSQALYKGLAPARDARKVLNRQLAGTSDRRIVLDVDAEANATALPQFTSAMDSGSDVTIKEGMIGRKLGFDWYMNQNVLTHDTQAAGTITTSGGGNILGASTLTVAGCTTAPAEGDVFRTAGDPQYYVVQAGSTTGSWKIAPALRSNIPDATAITVVADHVVNLAFHKDAFALAVRPLLDVDPLGNRIETFTDDVSGLTMRLEISRQNKQTLFSFDVLYGVALVRPECACRIVG